MPVLLCLGAHHTSNAITSEWTGSDRYLTQTNSTHSHVFNLCMTHTLARPQASPPSSVPLSWFRLLVIMFLPCMSLAQEGQYSHRSLLFAVVSVVAILHPPTEPVTEVCIQASQELQASRGPLLFNGLVDLQWTLGWPFGTIWGFLISLSVVI